VIRPAVSRETSGSVIPMSSPGSGHQREQCVLVAECGSITRQQLMVRSRGNPGWSSGRGAALLSNAPCGFEREVARLRLKPEQYPASVKLREWCARNRRSHYIPEELLKAWGLDERPIGQDASDTQS
jgi:hypothetical protein